MKKIILGMIVLTFFVFLIPILFSSPFIIKDNEEAENRDNDIQVDAVETFDYGKINMIKLLIVSTGEIKEIHLDEYIKGVVASEMPAEYHEEALKTQALVARSYTLNKLENNSGVILPEHNGADMCDNYSHCQAWISKEERLSKWPEENREEYWSKISLSVDSTKGEIITYNSKVINALFHANSGGKTESSVDVWGGVLPYIQVVETISENDYSQYSSRVELNKEDFLTKLKEKYSQFEIDFNSENCIKITEYTDGGRVRSVNMGNITLSGIDVRTIFELKSANFIVNVNGDNIIFEVTGYGHGVGMSQTGANTLAKQGKNYKEIIQYYYKDVNVEQVNTIR